LENLKNWRLGIPKETAVIELTKKASYRKRNKMRIDHESSIGFCVNYDTYNQDEHCAVLEVAADDALKI
jgi:hypothetical protein